MVRGIPIEVVRKDIKNFHLGVYPPHGRVRVAAPLCLDDEAIRLAIVSRLAWIRRKRAHFQDQDRQSQREMVTGESHYFQGRRFRLRVVERAGRPSVSLANNTTMALRLPPGTSRSKREAVLQEWYRKRLREQIPGLMAKWRPRAGVEIGDVRIKRMKTLWGSCNAKARRIWLNLELVKKPPSCVKYVFVHEMVHLIERHHNENFLRLMDTIMPQWRAYRDELNRAPLAHEEWGY